MTNIVTRENKTNKFYNPSRAQYGIGAQHGIVLTSDIDMSEQH